MDPDDVGPNINEADQVEPGAFVGFYLGVTSGEGGAEMEFRLIPADSIEQGRAKANTAVQPDALGSTAFMDSGDLEDFIDARLGGLVALLAQINGPA